MDGYIIRTRWNKDDEWRYEICDQDDLDNYYCAESDYTNFKDPQLIEVYRNIEMEIISKQINIGQHLEKRLFDE